MPNIILEAAAFGIPIVSSSVGGISEFLDVATGCLVADPLAVNEYVAALHHLSERPELCAMIGDRLARKVYETRSFDGFVEQVSELPVYHELLRDREVPVE